MSQAITIQMDLDSDKYVGGLKKIESESDRTAQNIGRSFNSNIDASINKGAVGAFDNLSAAILRVSSAISTLIGAATVISGVVIFIENRFGTFSKVAEKLGLDFGGIVDRMRLLKDALAGFASGEKSFGSVKFAAALLLRELGLIDGTALGLVNTFSGLKRNFNETTASIFGMVVAGGVLYKNMALIGDSARVVSRAGGVLLGGKGILGITSAASALSLAMYGLSKSLESSDNSALKFASGSLKVLSIALGGAAAGIGYLIYKSSELAQNVGTKLVGFFQSTVNKFYEMDSSSQVFSASLDSMNRSMGSVAGTNEEWNDLISKTSKNLNISVKSLQNSAQEIVLVGSHMDLTTEQMKKLLEISSEYAKINHKDVFDTTVAVTSALNGNSQAVQALGIKLSEASIQQFAYSTGVNKSIEKMSESEKIQLRFNKLLSQYGDIAGIGAVAAGSLADQQNKLKVITDSFSNSIGKGAFYIEDTSIFIYALNKALSVFGDTTLAVAGFFGAFGARILQIGGFFLEWTIKIYGAVKAIRLLDTVLQSDFGARFFTTNLPFINKNLDTLINGATGSSVKIRSLNDALTVLGSSGLMIANQMSTIFLGANLKNVTVMGVLKNTLDHLGTAFSVLSKVFSPVIIPLVKIGSVVGVVVGAFYILKEAFEIIEKNTQFFSKTWELLVSEFNSSVGVFAPILSFFSSLWESIRKVAYQGFGLFITGVTKIFSVLAGLAAANPFNVFSKQTVQRLTELKSNLDGFSSSLSAVAYDVSQLPGDADRAIAGVAKKATVNIEELLREIDKVRGKYENVGLSDVEIIRKEQDDALMVLKNGLNNKLISEIEYNTLRKKINDDANSKIAAANKKAWEYNNMVAVQAAQMMNTSVANAISNGIQNIIQSLADGEDVFKNFAAFIVQTFGDMAIQLGSFFIAQGIAIGALMALQPAAMVAAGAALVALGAVLKSFVGNGIGGGKKTAGVANPGTQAAPGQQIPPDIANPNTVQERQAPTTNVKIDVQGSLVRQEELGEFITRTLNETFGKQGVTLRDARIRA